MDRGIQRAAASLAPRAWLAAARDCAGEDPLLARLALAFAVAQLLIIGWDQPSAFGWENDGVAPRDFLRGVAGNLLWGHAHRYPLFHNLVLLLICLPVLLPFVVAGPWSAGAISARVQSVACMTAVSLLIKLAHVAMGCGLLLLIARIARRLFGVAAGRCAALCAVTCLTFGYYARASNLDGPYMFWTALAIDRLLSVLQRGHANDYALTGLFAAASVATKDQAYAAYVLPVPLYLGVLPLVAPGRLGAGEAHFRLLRRMLLWGALGYAALAGVIVNPTGFIARVRMLLGTNSQDWRNYARSVQGLWLNLRDLWFAQASFLWSWGVVALCWGGVALALLLRPEPGEPDRAQRLLPICAGLSSVVAFTLPVARCEHRFLLPLGVWLCVYGGFALVALWRRAATRPLAWAAGAALLLSAYSCVLLALTQWGDPRREVERFLLRLPRGSVVEIYGFDVFQPRFDSSTAAPYRVQRVGLEPPGARARLPGLRELQAEPAAVGARRPDAIVVASEYAERFLPRNLRPGEIPSAQWLAAQADRAQVAYFRALVGDTLPGYRTALRARARLPGWALALGARPVRIHDSTAGTYYVLVPASPR